MIESIDFRRQLTGFNRSQRYSFYGYNTTTTAALKIEQPPAVATFPVISQQSNAEGLNTYTRLRTVLYVRGPVCLIRGGSQDLGVDGSGGSHFTGQFFEVPGPGGNGVVLEW